jgi:hypothetical protein
MGLFDPTRGGATFCMTHNRWECVKNKKKTRGGGRCHGPAIRGIDRCRMHAGEKSSVAKAKGEAVSAWSALEGEPVVSTGVAVLGMLQMSWLRAHLLAGLLEQQFARAHVEESGDGEGAEADAAGTGEQADPALGLGAGLIGHTRGAVKDVGIYATGEAARALTILEAAERDRVVRFAKVAHDMGIAEQQVRIAEQQGVLLADVIRRTTDGLLRLVVELMGELAQREPGADRFVGVAEQQMRAAWPGWLSVIVPQEITAVTEVPIQERPA